MPRTVRNKFPCASPTLHGLPSSKTYGARVHVSDVVSTSTVQYRPNRVNPTCLKFPLACNAACFRFFVTKSDDDACHGHGMKNSPFQRTTPTRF